MDPVTIIVTALATGAAAGLTPTAEQVVRDAYAGIKALLKRKFSADNDLIEAVAKLEQKPDSEGRKVTLKEEVVAAKADQDEELVSAAKSFLQQLEAQPGGRQIINLTVQGDWNNVSGTGNISVKNYGRGKE